MRLTTTPPWHLRTGSALVRLSGIASGAVLAGVTAGVFALDRLTDVPGAQHLYYFPIILAAVRFGTRGGAAAASLTILLYHLANPHMLTWRYGESDILQMGVFIAAGLVAARLADDAQRLHRLAMTDDLTGLHNLRSFELEMRRIVRAARRARTSVSVLVLDVDRLKALNDEHGHLAGAEAVRVVGQIIGEHIPADAVACRYGGDEFVVAIPLCAAPCARRVADALRLAVQATAPVLAGVSFAAGTLSISIGLAHRSFNGKVDATGSDDDVSEELFRSADVALYVAKNGGRNRVCSA